MTSALLPLLLVSRAHALDTVVEICFEFQIDFSDVAWGDHWVSNANRVARGVEFQLTDDVRSVVGHMSATDGCVDLTVTTSGPDHQFDLVAWPRAEVNGIELESYWSDTFTVQTIQGVGWQTNDPTVTTSFVKELPNTQVWHNLAVATWLMHRNTLHVDQDPDRGCCVEDTATTEYLPDGTCGSAAPPGQRYARIAPPIRMYTDPDPSNPNETVDYNFRCGGSTVQGNPALAVWSTCDKKFVLAHELGHVIAMMRVGGPEERQLDAPVDGCTADFQPGLGLEDPGGVQKRGKFTKEYMAAALREGWGDFVSIWAWNKRTETDCVLRSITETDFDLDGVIDNATHRLVDCGGTPWVDTAEPPSTYLDATNWLDDVETHTGNGCARDTDAVVEANRSTVYDVSKMFFRLTNTSFGGRNPAEVADLYVDTCPRGWQERDDGDMFGHVDERPLERLRISAEHHLLDTALVFDHVEH